VKNEPDEVKDEDEEFEQTPEVNKKVPKPKSKNKKDGENEPLLPSSLKSLDQINTILNFPKEVQSVVKKSISEKRYINNEKLVVFYGNCLTDQWILILCGLKGKKWQNATYFFNSEFECTENFNSLKTDFNDIEGYDFDDAMKNEFIVQAEEANESKCCFC